MSFWRNTLAKLFEDHRRQLVAMVVRRIRDREVAAELVQDVYARLMQSGDCGEPEANTKMLYASVRNAVIDHHRSTFGRAKAMNGVLPDQIWQCETTSPYDHAEARQALSALDRALLELSPKAREMFILHRVDGISNTKLAKKYGISVSAVEKQLARTMRHCQERLAAYRDDVL
ncbi:sigma-70 family RNA polymerase sigma factor [Thalassospiraceae bacterium SW-3-3]|nr:sigma-70 family RNA polymerase sigma factor [Thalassospiraceae bacterium SW-3-3]